MFFDISPNKLFCKFPLLGFHVFPFGFGHKDPVVNEIFNHFKQYWGTKQCNDDGYQEEAGQDAEANIGGDNGKEEVPESEGLEVGTELTDLELAKALGVPGECIDRLTPKKGAPGPPENDGPTTSCPPCPPRAPCPPSLTADERDARIKKLQRDLRIKKLK